MGLVTWTSRRQFDPGDGPNNVKMLIIVACVFLTIPIVEGQKPAKLTVDIQKEILDLVSGGGGEEINKENMWDQIHHTLVDRACTSDNDFMECISKCTQYRVTNSMFNKVGDGEDKKESYSVEKFVRFMIEMEEDPFGCLAHCRTDPKFAVCKANCDQHNAGIEYISHCLSQDPDCSSVKGDEPWKDSKCLTCMENYIDEKDGKSVPMCRGHYQDRDVACKDSLKDCVNFEDVKSTADLKECFSVRQMERDIENCRSEKLPEDLGNERCNAYLIPKYCKDLCQPGDNGFTRCISECNEKTTPLCENACTAADNVFNACKHGSQTLECFSRAMGHTHEASKYINNTGEPGTGFRYAQYLSDTKCMKETIESLKNYIDDPETRKVVFPKTDNDTVAYGWLTTKPTMEECYHECLKIAITGDGGKERRECVQDHCSVDLSNEEKQARCDHNPLRSKSLIHWAAAVGKSLQYAEVEKVYQAADPLSSGYFMENVDFTTSTAFPIFSSKFQTPKNECLTTCRDPNHTKGLLVEHSHCHFECFKEFGLPFIACQDKPDVTVDLTDFSNCRWLVDLSLTNSPDALTSKYFNEKVAYDQKDKLLKPNSYQYLQEIEDAGSKGFFVFPYFLVIRAECDGGYYDEAFYRLFMQGGYPTVDIQHWPTTSRDPYSNLFKGVFRGALINLTRNPDHIIIPENPSWKDKGGLHTGCHWEICYPGFAVPLPLYRIPQFEVTIESQDTFNSLTEKIYIASFNSRDAEGTGHLAITNASIDSRFIALPKLLFPTSRVSRVLDTGLDKYEKLAVGVTSHGHVHIVENKDDEFPRFPPLDREDFFSPQFTFGTTPVIAIAGFYDPSLVIIGDPDMNNFDLIRWTLNDPKQNVSIFSGEYVKEDSNNKEGDVTELQKFRCLDDTFHASGYEKLMYNQFDYTDDSFVLRYYRVRNLPQNYRDGRPTPAIMEIIALEDRFLLVTPRGLVTFYGNTNATLGANKLFKAPSDERLETCFKFVRVSQRAGQENDLIVGVSYNYIVGGTEAGSDSKVSNQEIYVGVLSQYGGKIEWTKIGNRENPDEDYNVPDDEEAGKIIPLDPEKAGGIPIRQLETNAKSEVERICIEAYKEDMGANKDIQLQDVPGWCEAIDAAPDTTQANTVLLLVRMRVYYSGKVQPDGVTGGPLPVRNVFFYIIASHTLITSIEEKVEWNIVSILPRIPCIDEHKESVQNVLVFEENYFAVEGTLSDGNQVLGCQNINVKSYGDYLFINRLTFSRTISKHLFLFGSRLLQSADGGKTFISLSSFPVQDQDKNKPEHLGEHRIEVMAFDEKGHYAFLTNKRELWIGSMGDLKQIRIRPSEGYSITQTTVSSVKGLQDAVPFSLLYDSNNALFELVAIVGSDGEVERIMKRVVPVSLTIRNQELYRRLKERNDKQLKTKLVAATKVDLQLDDVLITYDPSAWSLYCPFSSAKLSENYSATHSRNQVFFFTPPLQHSSFGRAYDNPSLWAYQTATFSLAWKSFFKLEYEPYANSLVDPDPFKRWILEKEATAKVGLLRFIQGDKDQDGILVDPSRYKRLDTNTAAKRIFRFYTLDYGIVVRLEFVFSIKNDASLGVTDYFSQQISQIQLNIDNPNGTLLLVDTEKVPIAHQASVRFVVHLSVIKSPFLLQYRPGEHLIPNTVVFHLIGGFGKCDLYSTLVYVGCRPSTDLLFNWNSTLHSIKFRDRDAHFGKQGECYGGEFVCFFARAPLVFFFDVFDVTKQSLTPYTGNYVMRVVAGGYSRDKMEKYTQEEIEAFNIPGVSDVSLIWNEWDVQTGKKVDRKPVFFEPSLASDPKRTSRESVLQSGISAIEWTCHTLSPCARISPNLGLQTVYWFRIFISNRGVDNSTLCLFEKEFDIMLYGFPPSPETQLLTTIVFCICMFGILYLLFVCCRNHKRVWRGTKVKLYGWYQIVRDTFPKALKTHEDQGPDDRKTQQQKDNIIMSLQGHLKIPSMSHGESTGETQTFPARRRVSSISARSGSLMSVQSSISQESRSQLSVSSKGSVLPPVAPRAAPTTWTDLVYEQIIAKRLAAIVNKNRKMRVNILQKASLMDRNIAEEKIYEDAHKHTISEESFISGKTLKK